MKKLGFTLAEVLITLGIVGVIAAITLPALMADTTSAQIGPKLAKAVAAFEQANQVLLNNNDVDALTDAYTISNTSISEYTGVLTNYLKADVISSYTGTYDQAGDLPLITGLAGKLLTKDGMIFIISGLPTSKQTDTGLLPHKQRIGAVYVDINGQTKPNTAGIDLFAFSMWNDGSLKPVGGNDWWGEDSTLWTEQCADGAIPENALYCTGHIFENNLKVLYK